MTIVTVKASGGDYPSLSAAITGCPTDITAAGTNQTWEIECYADAPSTQVTISGKTTDSTHYIRIYTPLAERFAGDGSGGFTITPGNSQNGITISSVVNVIVEGVKFVAPATTPLVGIQISGAVAAAITVKDCLFSYSTTTYGGVRVSDRTSGYVNVVNCVGYFGSDGTNLIHAASGSGHTVRGYNCTAYSTHGSQPVYNNASGVTCIVKNCIGETGAGNPWAGTWSGNNNVSSSASVPGTSGTTSSRVAFTDDTVGNLTLTSGDTIAKDTGADLSGDSDYPFTTDILGNSRTGGTWDRGAFEYGAGGGGGTNLIRGVKALSGGMQTLNGGTV